MCAVAKSAHSVSGADETLYHPQIDRLSHQNDV